MKKTKFELKGEEVRNQCKILVLEFMLNSKECQKGSVGMKQSQIFKNCGLDWGNYPLVTSSQQHYWIVAILSELNKEGKVERVTESGPWRLL